jgi:2-keto-3-deoxy-6-phosphogluconate aldolase
MGDSLSIQQVPHHEEHVFPRLRTLRTIDESGAVLIVRLPDSGRVKRVAHAAVVGEFRALETTLPMSGAVDLVHRSAEQYASQGVVVGAGTRKSAIAQRLAREYGAECMDKDAMSARFVEPP